MTGRGRVFLDTGVILAAVLPKDPDHAAAVDILHRLAGGEWRSAHTSDYVVAEALNFVRMKVKRATTAQAIVDLVFGSEELPTPVVGAVLRIHSARFARALARYSTEFDRGLSFTDWTSVAAMEDAGVAQIATFDGGFRGVVNVVPGLI